MQTRAAHSLRPDWRGRAWVFAVIVAGHFGALLAMSRWTGARPSLEVPTLQVQLLPEAAPATLDLPPPPRLELEPPAIEVPEPEVAIDWTPEPTSLRVALLSPSLPAPTARDDAPRLVSHVDYAVAPRPVYPVAARKRREQGLVILKVLVDVHGTAAAVEVHTSSGFPLLDTAARDAAHRTRFHPYRENGIARAVFVLLPIEFGLNSRRSHS